MTAPVLAVRELSVHDRAGVLLQGVSFELPPGQALTVLGHSGSGKSLLLQAVMAGLPPTLRQGGEVRLDGRTIGPQARRALWGRSIGWLPQEPSQALDPTMRAVPQVAEVHRWIRALPPAEARVRAEHDLQRLGVPATAGARYPHELSGGMAQRVALAATLAGGATLLLVDEPTKGLDALRRDQIVEHLQRVLAAGGSVLAVTHDLAVARALGGQVLVMHGDGVAEQGPAGAVLREPRHAYTRALLAAEPGAWAARAPSPLGGGAAPLVEGLGLALSRGGHRLFSGLDLAVRPGERWAVCGPSGAGKTSLGHVLLGLMPPDAGTVRRREGLRPQALQKLYQDPQSAFAPHVSLRAQLHDVLRRHRLAPSPLHALRERLGLADRLLDRRPAAVSGGELQRVALLRVLLVAPALLFADEPTSRLDPITQREVLELLLQQLEASGAALLLVTHDAALAAHVAGRRLDLDAPPAG